MQLGRSLELSGGCHGKKALQVALTVEIRRLNMTRPGGVARREYQEVDGKLLAIHHAHNIADWWIVLTVRSVQARRR